MTQPSQPADGPKLTFLGKFFILLVIGACFYGAYLLFFQRAATNGGGNAPQPGVDMPVAMPTETKTSPSGVTPPAPSGEMVQIGIAHGTEKGRWLKAAVEEFAKTPDGKKIQVNLIPMGSIEGAQAVLRGDQRINVWSPASSMYREVLTQEWQLKNSANPIAREETLALTPMVFVMWDDRYNAFITKYQNVTFTTLAQALQEKGGWDAIAGKSDWGLFKLGHTSPGQSNSGLATLVLAAYDYFGKTRDLTMKDIMDVKFQTWMADFERGVTGMSNSTDNQMKDMVLRGPSTYDCLVVYESVAIDNMKYAEGRWGRLRVVYPKYNMWNDNPYYVLDVPWSTAQQKKAAETFMQFLLTEPIQKLCLSHGFRPGNPSVPIKFQDSPFVMYQQFGLTVDLNTVCDIPKTEVINNLLASWQRTQGGR